MSRMVDVFNIGRGTLGLPITQIHTLITGVTGSGKSTTIRVAIAGAAYEPDVALVLLDPKRGAELGSWAPRAARLARTPAECADVLTEIVALMEARYDHLAGVGRQNWEADDGPFVLVVVDELRVLFRGGSDKEASKRSEEALADLLLMARAVGISIMAATQRPDSDSLSLAIRDQFAVRVAHRLGSIESTRMVFPDMAEQAPAHRLPEGREHAGRCWVMLDGMAPVSAWTMWLDGADVATIAAQTADRGPELSMPDVTPAGPSRATWAAPRAATDDELLSALAHGPVTYEALATVVRLTPDACRGRLRRLEAAGLVDHVRGSALWALRAS